MKKLSLGILIIILLFASTGLFVDDEFHLSFWSNLISDLIVAAISGIILIQFTEIFSKPKLKIVPYQNGLYREKIVATKNSAGEYEFSAKLAIKNEGSKTVKPGEGYWHIYFHGNDGFSVDFSGDLQRPDPDSTHIRNLIAHPVLPKSFLDINADFKGKILKKDGKYLIYYFISTDYGYFPKTVEVDQKTGFVSYNSMAYIPIELE